MIFGDGLIVLFLIIARVTGLFILIPLFNSKSIPVIAKIWFIIFVSLLIVPTTIVNSLDFSNFMMIAYYIIIELLNGILIGTIILLALSAIYIAGHLIDMGIGFSMVSVINPLDGNQMAVSANLYYIVLMLVFLITNTHHALIRALVRSFDIIPLGQMLFNEIILSELIRVLTIAMELGVKIAMPITLTIVVANVILGILAKAMPGMNVFVIGMPFKIMIGLAVMLITIPFFYTVFTNMLNEMIDEVNRLIIMFTT